MQWKKTFTIPAEAKLSSASIDILQRLICDAECRLGRNGVDEIKAHPFFKDVDWERMKEVKAPYIPEVKNETSNEHFD